MNKALKILYIILLVLAIIITFFVGFIFHLYFTSEIIPPKVKIPQKYELINHSNYQTYGPCYFKKNSHGLYELYIEGNPIDRGNAYGFLLKDLLYYQEEVFVHKLHEYVHNETYLKFLRYILRIGMRGVTNYIPNEYCKELFAISQYCTNEFNWAGSPYERQINYHAAHDIGHAMVDYMLVGCSSFGCWDSYSNDSSLIIGRNFDFYINDEFAKNKLITICNPDKGYKFISISWPGMIGVVSGMNSKGLTITINAAKDKLPTKTATPITILTREILQYASNIDEAFQIASKHKTFVAESILIGSAIENKAAIIEKTTDETHLFYSNEDYILCTNHFQSDKLLQKKHNIENIKYSDSNNRFNRLDELINDHKPINPIKSADILRNPYETKNSSLKLCNDCAINQFIAHHSVIFKPKELKMWVSTYPWQIGEYICYNLNDTVDFSTEITVDSLTIPCDTILYSKTYNDIIYYHSTSNKIFNAIYNNTTISQATIDSFINCNPNHHQTYNIIGNYYESKNNLNLAKYYWNIAIKKNPCKLSDRNDILNKINK